MIEAPRCKRCQGVNVEGRGDLCSACVQARRKGSTKRRHRPLLCDCGLVAVVVTPAQVGTAEGGLVTVRMPLCEDCVALENEILSGGGVRRGEVEVRIGRGKLLLKMEKSCNMCLGQCYSYYWEDKS